MTQWTDIKSALRGVGAALEGVAHEEAALQARLLVCYALGIKETELILCLERPFPAQYKKSLDALVKERVSGTPLQYILGEWYFMGLPFYCEEGVLIPRSDTETLAETAIATAMKNKYKTVLDMCCGTGCIGISCAKLAHLSVTSADISDKCVALTKKNAERNGVDISVIKTDMFESVTGSFDMILINPPYIRTSDIDTLQIEVQREPRLALDGGEDGLDFYRRIQKEYKAHLSEGGTLIMEVGCDQAHDVMAIFGGGCAVRDISEIERVIVV